MPANCAPADRTSTLCREKEGVQGTVGRKSRRGRRLLPPCFNRAGFEPCVRVRPACPRPGVASRRSRMGCPRHSSNPARQNPGENRIQSAPRFSPYRSLYPSAHKGRDIQAGDPPVHDAEFLEDGDHQFFAVGIPFGMLGVPARVGYSDRRLAAIRYLNENRVEAA